MYTYIFASYLHRVSYLEKMKKTLKDGGVKYKNKQFLLKNACSNLK